jgi:hypothetical protein
MTDVSHRGIETSSEGKEESMRSIGTNTLRRDTITGDATFLETTWFEGKIPTKGNSSGGKPDDFQSLGEASSYILNLNLGKQFLPE